MDSSKYFPVHSALHEITCELGIRKGGRDKTDRCYYTLAYTHGGSDLYRSEFSTVQLAISVAQMFRSKYPAIPNYRVGRDFYVITGEEREEIAREEVVCAQLDILYLLATNHIRRKPWNTKEDFLDCYKVGIPDSRQVKKAIRLLRDHGYTCYRSYRGKSIVFESVIPHPANKILREGWHLKKIYV